MKLYRYEAQESISFGAFDSRFDGKGVRVFLGLCLPGSQRLEIFKFQRHSEDHKWRMSHLESRAGVVSVAAVRATRVTQQDLLVLKADSTLEILTFDLRSIPIRAEFVSAHPETTLSAAEDVSMVDAELDMHIDASMASTSEMHTKFVSIEGRSQTSVVLVCDDGKRARLSVDLVPTDDLITSTLYILAIYCKAEVIFQIIRRFIALWTARHKSMSGSVQFDCLAEAILGYYGISWKSTEEPAPEMSNPWEAMMNSSTHFRLRDDTALMNIVPRSKPPPPLDRPEALSPEDINALHVILMGLHVGGEEMRMYVHMHESLLRLSTLTLRLSQLIRPAFSDLLKRLYPTSADGWKSGKPSPFCIVECLRLTE